MITSMQMYWLLKLDDIRDVAQFIEVVSFILLAILLVVTMCCVTDCYLEDWIDKIKKIVSTLFFSLCISLLVYAFVPSTKQMATMYVVPLIVNNDKIQNMGNKTLDIGSDLLELTKQYLEEKMIKKEE